MAHRAILTVREKQDEQIQVVVVVVGQVPEIHILLDMMAAPA
jgi:hypothetical protein